MGMYLVEHAAHGMTRLLLAAACQLQPHHDLLLQRKTSQLAV
jgi:hypothetical protein